MPARVAQGVASKASKVSASALTLALPVGAIWNRTPPSTRPRALRKPAGTCWRSPRMSRLALDQEKEEARLRWDIAVSLLQGYVP
jgi:hypothetical protein